MWISAYKNKSKFQSEKAFAFCAEQFNSLCPDLTF